MSHEGKSEVNLMKNFLGLEKWFWISGGWIRSLGSQSNPNEQSLILSLNKLNRKFQSSEYAGYSGF